MRTASLLVAAVLLAACSEDMPSDNAVITPAATPPGAPEAQKKEDTAAAPAEKADMAAAEASESSGTPNPCDLSGYDMNHMTVDMHEELVKSCGEWKARQP